MDSAARLKFSMEVLPPSHAALCWSLTVSSPLLLVGLMPAGRMLCTYKLAGKKWAGQGLVEKNVQRYGQRYKLAAGQGLVEERLAAEELAHNMSPVERMLSAQNMYLAQGMLAYGMFPAEDTSKWDLSENGFPD